MEGFGVLRAAELTGVPALEVRVISNVVTDADRSRWMIPEALAVLGDAVARLVPALRAACSGLSGRGPTRFRGAGYPLPSPGLSC
jgi:futalosine hydrolase